METLDIHNHDGFQQGFRSLNRELSCDELELRGEIPAWLGGTLVRNGPAKFDVGDQALRHWFDGFAMLHAFRFSGGKVAYLNRFLQSRTYRNCQASGKPSFSAFAADPCRSLFGRVCSLLFADADNTNVSVARIADRFVALTETPMAIEFDPHTLETLGAFRFDKPIPGDLTTAHPIYDAARDELVNYALRFGLISSYHVTAARGMNLCSLDPIWTIEPSYMHSFALTERYVVLSVFPFVISPIDVFVKEKPLIANFRWQPERGTRFIVIDRAQVEPPRIFEAEPCFGFHHINAFEHDDELLIDLIAYPDPSIIEMLAIDTVSSAQPMPAGEPRRFRLPLRGGRYISSEPLSSAALELPQFDEGRRRARPYRFVYGVGARQQSEFLDQLVRVDLKTGDALSWGEAGCYPGEPVFVPRPGGDDEDDGLILSVVLDGETCRSFLLLLDARGLEEVGRALVPHHIPFGFHGSFFEGLG